MDEIAKPREAYRVIRKHKSFPPTNSIAIPKLYSARQIYVRRLFPWVKCYKTILIYMDKYRHVLKPVRCGRGTGYRYYVREENITEFLSKFDNNLL